MYRVDEATCTGCGDCADACPAGAIALVGGRARINDATCADCGSCADACPQGAITMADVLHPAHATSQPGAHLAPIGLASGAIVAASPLRRPLGEVLPAAPRHSRIWPMVGGALVWAARELLPELLAAWRTSRTEVLQPASHGSVTVGLTAAEQRRAGHRHRWGRA